jgi:hypothetical protein
LADTQQPPPRLPANTCQHTRKRPSDRPLINTRHLARTIQPGSPRDGVSGCVGQTRPMAWPQLPIRAVAILSRAVPQRADMETMECMNGRWLRGWRWVAAATVIVALVLGTGVVLRAKGLGTAANAVQLLGLAPLVATSAGLPHPRRRRNQARSGWRHRLLGSSQALFMRWAVTSGFAHSEIHRCRARVCSRRAAHEA